MGAKHCGCVGNPSRNWERLISRGCVSNHVQDRVCEPDKRGSGRVQHVLQMQRLEAMERNPLQPFRQRQLLGDRVHLIQQTKCAAGVPMVTLVHRVEPKHHAFTALRREYANTKEHVYQFAVCHPNHLVDGNAS